MTDTKPKRTTKTVTAAPAEKKPAEKKAPVKAATAVKKAAAKPVAKPASTAKAAPKAPKKAPAAKKPVLDEDFRMRMITDTAYYLSVKRSSFASPEDDWLFAELLVDSVAFAVGKK
jgi:hypothetical protein